MPDDEQPLRHRWLAWAAIPVALLWITYDSLVFYRISAGRSETYRRFAQADYSYLTNKPGIAYDIGFVGYFTRGYVLDVFGLANGREVAKLKMSQRLADYARKPIDFIFVNDPQLSELRNHLDLTNWQTVGTFDFPNFNGTRDTHWLMVRPGIAPPESRTSPVLSQAR